MRTRIKFCGITRIEDALAALEAGADALGFVFYPPSKRYITPVQAASIIRQLPPLVSKVGLFVDDSHETILETQRISGIDTLQLHGDESPAFCEGFSFPVLKALRVRGPETIARIQEFKVQAVLLDAYVAGEKGGTGEKFDWALARKAVTESGRPIVLAGGLTVENVGDAVKQVHPFAVDVSSGIEAAPGIKEASLMRRFAQDTWAATQR